MFGRPRPGNLIVVGPRTGGATGRTGGRVEQRGRLLGNRYELLVVLATGGMGRVWRARDTLLERPVAVKILRSEFTGNATFRARFRAEAQHTAALHHLNIASVFDYGELEEDGEQLAYLVMELVEGETLTALLEREGALDAGRTLDLLRQTSAALAAAHAAGLIHRDVKPGNILMGTDGVIKITDFGIAWSASSVPLTRTGQVVGTAHYLAPEQAAGGKASPASDVYALGLSATGCWPAAGRSTARTPCRSRCASCAMSRTPCRATSPRTCGA